MAMRIHTIGHSTREAGEFVGLLRGHGVGLVVDVRRYPGSRRHPQFNRESLEAELSAAGVEYMHAPGLGGRRGGSGRAGAGPNRGWRNASFRAYADYMGTPEFGAALDGVLDAAEARAAAGAGTVALMCAEAVPWQCHRNLISDALVGRGVEVLHILSESDPAVHELNAMARVDASGAVTYPGGEPHQGDLFD